MVRIYLGLGNGAPIHQLLATTIVVLGTLVLRFSASEFSAGVAVIQGHQQLPARDLLTLLEVDFRYPPWYFCQQHNGLSSTSGAHSFYPVIERTLDTRR